MMLPASLLWRSWYCGVHGAVSVPAVAFVPAIDGVLDIAGVLAVASILKQIQNTARALTSKRRHNHHFNNFIFNSSDLNFSLHTVCGSHPTMRHVVYEGQLIFTRSSLQRQTGGRALLCPLGKPNKEQVQITPQER